MARAKILATPLVWVFASWFFLDAVSTSSGPGRVLVAQEVERRPFYPLGVITSDGGDELYAKFYVPDYIPRLSKNSWTSDSNLLLLNSDFYAGQLQFSDDQLDQFSRVLEQANQRGRKFTLTYDDLNDIKFQPKLQEFFRESNEFISGEIESILLPHQKKLLKNFAHRQRVQTRSFIEIITTDPVSNELELSEEQIAELKKKHEKLDGKYAKPRRELLGQYRNQLVSVLSRDQIETLHQMLGDEFFKGHRIIRAATKEDPHNRQIGIAQMNLVEGKIKVKPRRVNLDRSPEYYRPYDYLAIKRLAQEVKLDEDQVSRIESHFEPLRREAQKEYDRTVEDNKTRMNILMSRLAKDILQKSIDDISRILKPGQVKAITHIYHQMMIDRTSFDQFLLTSRPVKFQVQLDHQNTVDLKRQRSKLQKEYFPKIRQVEGQYRSELIENLSKKQKSKLFELFGRDFFHGQESANKNRRHEQRSRNSISR